ncbi:MAG TPA: Holliday junction resolvase RuvX [Tepidisphaeraceae bacterium]|nr:Holliday junction resolvase RuvX [Tepidisphaeraceae bacterium]
MRTLAIDLGTRRVGLALSDQNARLATPYEVLQITAPAQAINQILSIIQSEGVEKLVVGVPLNMDSSIGPAARSAIEWGRELSRQSNCPVVFVDERLSSYSADQQLNDRKRAGEKLTRKRRKEQLDAVAAAGFLQDYLDHKLTELNL